MRIALALLVLLGSLSVSASSVFDDMKVRAEQGDADAQSALGYNYYAGKGTPQDYKEALRWYRASAEQGNQYAQSSLALMYKQGEGTPQDYKEALKWYRASAEQGYARAQNNLGVMYVIGKGVLQDYKSAHMWANLAAANGSAAAVGLRDAIAKEMTPADISEAQQMASDWIKAHP